MDWRKVGNKHTITWKPVLVIYQRRRPRLEANETIRYAVALDEGWLPAFTRVTDLAVSRNCGSALGRAEGRVKSVMHRPETEPQEGGDGHLCTGGRRRPKSEAKKSFFGSGEEHWQLYQYLENLCDYLYDDLRPRILHEPRLTALREAYQDADEPAAAGKPCGLGRLHISHLLQMVLQDAQTRLFFKAQVIIQSDIRYYALGAGDLMYPDKLVAVRKPTSGNDIKEKENNNQIFRLPSLDKQDTRSYNIPQPAIFDDVAQEAPCGTQPRRRYTGGQLFLVRHLLILKGITRNLDLVQRDVELSIDFSGVRLMRRRYAGANVEQDDGDAPRQAVHDPLGAAKQWEHQGGQTLTIMDSTPAMCMNCDVHARVWTST
ncbi:hypothetical protein BD779DRAFT_1472834 [Infundibulicybe gibba]|nr:hypothetical protein BD779DRAFT_1472834 [Infundibulicybe gibba]